MTTIRIIPILALALAGCAELRGTVQLDDGYARSLQPTYERAITACQWTDEAAHSGAFRWAGWIAADGTLTASNATPDDASGANPLARCVAEKLRHTRLAAPPSPSPFDAGQPVAFRWTP